MGFFYFTRHGETVWNVENKICGVTDVELTELGHEQAIMLGNEIKNKSIHIDEILTSPLKRAYDTAKHVSDIIKAPVYIEKRIIEQNFGKYESTPRDGEDFYNSKLNLLYDFSSGESTMDAISRIYAFLDELKYKSEDRVYLLVAHNGVSRIINSYFNNMKVSEFASFGIKNCELKKYDFNQTFEK